MGENEVNSVNDKDKDKLIDTEQLETLTQYIKYQLICKLLKKPSQTRNDEDIKVLSEQLKKIKFFEQFNNDEELDIIKECSKQLYLEKFKQNQEVFEIGTIGEKFYIILDGSVSVNIRLAKHDTELKPVKELQTGESFGEIALIYKKPRLATIMCVKDCIFGVLSQKGYQSTLQQRELIKMQNEMYVFQNMALFDTWSQHKLRNLYLNSVWLNFKKGDLVYDIDDSADNMFVIQEGEFVVYSKSNFEKVVGNDIQSEESKVMNQFKRVVLQKETSKTSQYLKVRMLCLGEYFGEEEILNDEPRKFRICCNSFEGKVLMIKKAHFLNHVFQDEVSQQYILNRLKDKTHKIEERINKMRNSLKDFKQFLFQDRSLVQQQILQKNIMQKSQIKDSINNYSIIDKIIDQKLQINNSQEQFKLNAQRQSTLKGLSPLKGQIILPALQSISSFNNFDQTDSKSPQKQNTSFAKQNTSMIKQNTAQFSDVQNISPKQNKIKFKFQQTQSFTNLLPNKSDFISNKNFDKHINESIDKISLSPIKLKEVNIKQVNQLHLNSPGKIQNSARGVQSLSDIPEENLKKINESNFNKPETNVKSLIIQDQDTLKDDQDSETTKYKKFQQHNQEINQQSNIQKIFDFGSESSNKKIKQNSQLKSADSSPFGNSPNKIINRSSKVTPTSNSGLIKPQSTITNFSQQAKTSQNKQTVFSRKNLNTQLQDRNEEGEVELNHFQTFNQNDHNNLQKQIYQRTNIFEEKSKLKNQQNNITYQQKLRSSTQHTQGESPQRNNKSMFNFILNKNPSYKNLKMDDYINFNLSPDQRNESLNKPSKNISVLSGEINDNNTQNQNEEEYSPFLKKKLKNIARKKQSVDQALINLGTETRTYFLSKQIPIVVKPPEQSNKEEIVKEQNLSLEKKQKCSFSSSFMMSDKNQVNNSQGDIQQLSKISLIQKQNTKNNKIYLRNASIDKNSLKLDQLNMLQSQQNLNIYSEHIKESHMQKVPENKKKIFLNLMNRSEVQQYFQKQMQMLNKANQIQQDKIQQSQLNVDDITQVSSKLLNEDRKIKTVSASVDSQARRSENNIRLSKQQNLKQIVFQNDSLSPQKSLMQTLSPQKNLFQNETPIHSQLPSLQNSQIYNFITEKLQPSQTINQ